MAKEKKVTEITDMEVDFAQWFTDVCKKAQLIDYSSIKGMFIYRPYGYAIWENIQRLMDMEFKKTGAQNVYMPMLIPESLLQKERIMWKALPRNALGSPMAAAKSWRSAIASAPLLKHCSVNILKMPSNPTGICR